MEKWHREAGVTLAVEINCLLACTSAIRAEYVTSKQIPRCASISQIHVLTSFSSIFSIFEKIKTQDSRANLSSGFNHRLLQPKGQLGWKINRNDIYLQYWFFKKISAWKMKLTQYSIRDAIQRTSIVSHAASNVSWLEGFTATKS